MKAPYFNKCAGCDEMFAGPGEFCKECVEFNDGDWYGVTQC